MNVIVDCGAVPALVRQLQAPPPLSEGDSEPRPYEHEVEKGSAFTLGLLAIKVSDELVFLIFSLCLCVRYAIGYVTCLFLRKEILLSSTDFFRNYLSISFI